MLVFSYRSLRSQLALSLLTLGITFGLPEWVNAQEENAVAFNEVLRLGDAAPAWNNLQGIDGNKHSLSDLEKTPVVVVVFFCNTCDIAREYEDRLLAFDRTYCKAEGDEPSRVKLVAINVNKGAEESLEKMKLRAENRGFTFQYLQDPSQQIAKQYGAGRTPEFFVLDAKRQVVYLGAMDDKTEPNLAKENYLNAAIDAVLAGKRPTKSSEPPRGCRIKYKSDRELEAEKAGKQ